MVPAFYLLGTTVLDQLAFSLESLSLTHVFKNQWHQFNLKCFVFCSIFWKCRPIRALCQVSSIVMPILWRAWSKSIFNFDGLEPTLGFIWKHLLADWFDVFTAFIFLECYFSLSLCCVLCVFSDTSTVFHLLCSFSLVCILWFLFRSYFGL